MAIEKLKTQKLKEKEEKIKARRLLKLKAAKDKIDTAKNVPEIRRALKDLYNLVQDLVADS